MANQGLVCINYRDAAETILVGGRLQPERGKCEAMMFEFFVRSHNVSVTPKDQREDVGTLGRVPYQLFPGYSFILPYISQICWVHGGIHG